MFRIERLFISGYLSDAFNNRRKVTAAVCCILQCLSSDESTLIEAFVFLDHRFVQYFTSETSSDIVY